MAHVLLDVQYRANGRGRRLLREVRPVRGKVDVVPQHSLINFEFLLT